MADAGAPAAPPIGDTLVDARGVERHFDLSPPWLERALSRRRERRVLKAVDGVDFRLARGETLALVGESGCGKSTLARLAVGLDRPTRGSIHIKGIEAADRPRDGQVQMVFQDPAASLNPRWRIADIVAEPLHTHRPHESRADHRNDVDTLLSLVGLAPADGRKFPHELSGGQQQRVSIARALAPKPEFLVCDEPTSALDVSVQAQILNLMKDLQRQLGLTYLFISHNLAVVHHIADRVGVMYLGRLVEVAPARAIFSRPQHPYTRLLLDAIPNLRGRRAGRQHPRGEVGNPLALPPGCAFHTRCPLAAARCRTERPERLPLAEDLQTSAACHAVEERRSLTPVGA